MRVIYFNNVNIENLGLIPLDIDVPSPKPKLYFVEVPGRNGKLDLTNFMGDVKYQNIDIKINCESFQNDTDVREMLNQFNGVTIALRIETKNSIEEYQGRVTAYTAKTNNSTTSVSITIDASPEVSYVSN